MNSVLITGGTGSLGNALIARLLKDNLADRIIIYSRDELKQAEMAQRFGPDADPAGGRLRFFLGDVRDPERLRMAMHGVEVVVHAAALKRVDAIAYNPSEVLRTNALGTHNVCMAAIEAGVGRVLLTSSDKSVEARNVYGSSKHFAEWLTVGANAYGYPRGTRLSCVRYGNVMGSRGSVVHLWRAALAKGKPFKITDERMTRFWMTLDQAVDLVLWALEHMRGGEIFVPALPSIRMVDLAEAIAPGHPREVVGWRPGGEKLHEALLTGEEIARGRVAVNVPAVYYVVCPDPHPWTAEDVWTDRPTIGREQYTSDANQWWLGVAELREWLKEIP